MDRSVSSKRVAVGGVDPVVTVTVTGADVGALPAASRATAVSVWEPSAAVVVSQETLYGLAVTSAPRFAPSSLNWTPTTPALSEALALTVVVPLTVAPLLGVVIATVGAALSTVTVTALLVVVLPAASRATAVSVWEPLAAPVVSQETLYGLAVSSAPKFAPSSLNCTPATPTLSDALALTGIVPLTAAPLAGVRIDTVGGVVSAALNVTVLSVLVEATLGLPAASWATPAPMLAITVPLVVMPLTATLKVAGPPDTTTVLVPPAVPLIVTSALVKSPAGSLNTTVKLIGDVLVGSAWPAAWSIVTVGGVLSTVTVTALLVAVLPAASRATAVRVWEPSPAMVVFQETLYGLAVSSTPRLAPSSLNCTPATPTLSDALALTAIVPRTAAPEAGEVMATVGGVVSLDTVTVTGSDDQLIPKMSRATAVSV